MRILVTGAAGFIGKSLCASLLEQGHEVVAAVRKRPQSPDSRLKYVETGDIGADSDWSVACQGVDVVIHLAARVHMLHDAEDEMLAQYRQTNRDATESLARAARAQGVRRMVFLSSIKVNGEATTVMPFSPSSIPDPQDSYGISKWEAEQALWQVSNETGLEVVIVRPPLVYGAGVKANFLRLLSWVDRGWPLPLGRVKNKRSMVYLGNLADALMLVATHPAAAGKTWLVSDGDDVSTPELMRRIAVALGKPDRTWSLPTQVLRGMGKLIGKSAEVERLTGSLQVDSTALREQLGWVPPYSMTQGLQATVAWYREQVRG